MINPNRTRSRRLATGLVATALLAAGSMTSAAFAAPAPDQATTTTSAPPPDTALPTTMPPATDPLSPTEPEAPNDDVIAPSEPSTSGDVAVAKTPMLQRSAMVVGATGFKLQYRFDGRVQTTNPTQASSITPEQFYDWSDEGHRYVQWDYPMPTDGSTTVTMSAPLFDFGKPTDYTLEYSSQVNRTAGSIVAETTCQILRDGVAVDLDNDSPFMCEGSSAQSATGAVQAGGSVRELIWQSVTGYIAPKNDGAGPKISLGDGTFSTANQEQRIIMNDTAWYPTEMTNSELRNLPYATIANGTWQKWYAADRNGIEQSEPDHHAQATFAYRIYLDGAPTSYWINGFAESYKYLSTYSTTGTCEIWLGNPDGDGEKSARATPFSCSATQNQDDGAPWYGFDVRMADVDTLHQQRDAKTRGVVEACTPDDGACIQAVGRPTLHVTDAENAIPVGDPNPNTSGAPREKEWKFSQEWSREVTDSAEQSFGMKTKTKFDIFGQDVEVELTSKTTYGYDLTKGISYEFKDVSQIPYGSVGHYTRLEAWNVYSGDLYFYGEGDRWYRVTGTEISVPIEPAALGGSSTFSGHVDAQQGQDLGAVQFKCEWDVRLKATVLLSNDTVRELNACQIPDGWDDTVPDIDGLEEVPKDIITQVREIQESNAAEFQKSLERQASELPVAGS